MNKNNGFTLIELLVALVVLAITIALAAPFFGSMLASNRVATQSNELISLFSLARSEALRLRGEVSVCPMGSFIDGLQIQAGSGCTGEVLHERTLSGLDSFTVSPVSTTQITYAASGTLTIPDVAVGLKIKLGSNERDLCIRTVGRVENQGC